jgi:hypothetical protein
MCTIAPDRDLKGRNSTEAAYRDIREAAEVDRRK